MMLVRGFLILAVVAVAGPTARADDTLPPAVGAVLQRYCIDCHGAEKQSANLRLDQLAGFRPTDRHLWTRLHDRLATGAMPPRERAQPTAAERDAVLNWVVERQAAHHPGGTRRLNRREAGAALRDVTGLAVDFAHAFPGDGSVAGFDTGADGLQDAADSVAVWVKVTRRAVDGLRVLDPPPGKVFRADLRAARDFRRVFDPWKDAGGQAREIGGVRPGLGGLLIEPRAVGDRERVAFNVPPPPDRQGVVRVKLVVSVKKPVPGLPNPRLWVDVGGRDIDYRELSTTDAPQTLEYFVHTGDLAIQKGVTVGLSNKVELPYAVEGYENEDRLRPEEKDKVPGGSGLFRPVFDRRALPADKWPAPLVILHELEIEPHHVAAWPPAAWGADVGELADRPEVAAKLLAVWTDRAWRRPTTPAEREPFAQLYAKLRCDGMAFDPALRAAFQAVLLSGQFRFLQSPAHPDPLVGQYAIASRLSFMLTGGPPDTELRRLAAEKKLRDPAVLDAQVDRLLTGPLADGFVRPFTTQWLELEQPITIAQTHLQKQDFRFARHLKASMREETIRYVGRLFAENRPARELVASDWTMMNDALARHYGYPPTPDGTLRPVTLGPDDPRGGGVLGHAGIQSMLCWMGDNWVIYRGAWVLRHVLDHPPPPPPLEVPELNPNDGKHRGKSFRELLKIHQEDGRCAVCHRTIDPAGFAFQNFDISGRWRDVEHEAYVRGELDGRVAWLGTGKTRPVDAAGRLPRGEEFRTFAEFKAAVVAHYQPDLARGILKNLTVYATGHPPDAAGLRRIAAALDATTPAGHPLRDLVKAVVRSPAFLDLPDARRNPP
jgi:mono/diheme cytochrome c family protein